MDKKIFIPEKYGRVICPSCRGHGYIEKSERQRCGGFGFIIKESALHTSISRGLGAQMVLLAIEDVTSK